MRIAHKGTEPGAVLSTADGDFTADDDGYFEVPDHIGFAQVKFPGWKQFGESHFAGERAPKPGENTSEDYAALSRRLDAVEAELAELHKPPAKTKAVGAK